MLKCWVDTFLEKLCRLQIRFNNEVHVSIVPSYILYIPCTGTGMYYSYSTVADLRITRLLWSVRLATKQLVYWYRSNDTDIIIIFHPSIHKIITGSLLEADLGSFLNNKNQFTLGMMILLFLLQKKLRIPNCSSKVLFGKDLLIKKKILYALLFPIIPTTTKKLFPQTSSTRTR